MSTIFNKWKGVGTCYTYIYLFVDWKKECINLSKLSDDAWYYTKKLSLQCLIGIKLLLHLIISFRSAIGGVMKYQK